MQTNLKTQQQEEYKQTELGLLPKEWKVVRLIDLVDLQRGTEVGSKNYNKDGRGIRFLRVVDVSGSRNEKIYTTSKNIKKCRENDVLITFDGSPGIVKRGLKGAYSSGIRKVIIKEESKILLDFVYYVAFTPFVQKTIGKYSTGVTIKHASKAIPHIKIPLPPLQEQKAIAFVLSTIQTAKEKTEQVIQATKELKKSLMKHLFTYGPVSLKDAEKVKLKETEIGKIPEGWDVVRLIETAEKDSDIVGGPFGSNLKVSDYKNSGVPIIRLQNIERNMFVNKDIKYVSEEKAEELRYHSFRAGDIILAKLGDPIGKTCIVPDYLTKGIVVADVVRIRTKEDITDKKYIVHVLNSSFVEKQFRQQKTGTTRPRVNVSNVRNIKIPLPPLQTQKKIASILSAVDEKIEKEENKKKALEELFKSMLYNLMSAKIRVKDLVVEK